MSSYVVGPFELEQRRLRGIVTQCQNDLNRTMNQMSQLRHAFAEEEAERRRREENLLEEQVELDRRYHAAAEEKEQMEGKRKSELRRQLKKNEEKLQFYQKQLGGMERASERQRKLEVMLESGAVDPEQLEREIRLHSDQIMTDVRKAVQGSSTQPVIYEEYSHGHRTKMVSLQMETETEAKRTMSGSSPKDVFAEKLRRAMISPYSGRFPSLMALDREFRALPEGMLTAYAVRNMAQLDNLIRQIGAIQTDRQSAGQKREKEILRYRALCRMLHEEPDETLLQDPGAGRALAHRCEQLFEKYKSICRKQYISKAVAAVMERHGVIFQDREEHVSGSILHFEMEHAQLDIQGTESNRIEMEVFGEYSGERPTVNERRQSAASAEHLCSMMTSIGEELRDEYGIILGNLSREEPEADTIYMRKRVESRNKKHHSSGAAKADSIS